MGLLHEMPQSCPHLTQHSFSSLATLLEVWASVHSARTSITHTKKWSRRYYSTAPQSILFSKVKWGEEGRRQQNGGALPRILLPGCNFPIRRSGGRQKQWQHPQWDCQWHGQQETGSPRRSEWLPHSSGHTATAISSWVLQLTALNF